MSLRIMCMSYVGCMCVKESTCHYMYVEVGKLLGIFFFLSSLGPREQHRFSGSHDKCFNSLSRLLGPICLYSFYDLAELPFYL